MQENEDPLSPRPPLLQEDNHSYYVSRTYGPGDARLRGLWVDMAAANRSHVKIHGILSNTHRQASVSPTGPGAARAVPGVPSPCRDFPSRGGDRSPHGGRQQLLHFSWWRARCGKCLGFPRASPGGQKGTEGDRGRAVGAGYPFPSRSHPSVHRPRELAPRQGRASTDGHGPIPVPAPRGFPPPGCCSHPPFSSPEDRPLLRLPLLRPPPAAGDDRHGR